MKTRSDRRLILLPVTSGLLVSVTKHRRGLTGHSERSSCILADPWHHGVEWALETSWRQVSA